MGLATEGRSDLETLRLRPDVRLMPLQSDSRSILKELPRLGSADYTTGNACVSCTRREQVKDILLSSEGTAIFGDGAGMRWLDDSWQHSVAVLNRSHDFTDTPPCLLFFGENGNLAHQITLWDPGAWEGFIELVCRHRGCWNCLRHRTGGPKTGRVPDCPAGLLREAWCEASSERDLDLRLGLLGLDRMLALRALEGLFTQPLAVQELASLLGELSALRLPVHVQLGNRHCVEVMEAPLEEVTLEAQGWEFQMGRAVIRMDPSRLDSLWFVMQPRSGQERSRFECYDGAGEQVLVLSSPQDPCPLVQLAWQGVIGRFEAGRPI